MIAQLQLLGQVLILVLVYVFVWRMLRAAHRDLAASGTIATHAPDARAAVEESTVMPAVGRAPATTRPARLVVVDGGNLRPGQPFHIDGSLTIGRGPDNDIQLDDDFLSGRHARVREPNVVTDLDSTNGTFINGARIHGSKRLSDGDMVRFGGVTFRFEEGS